MWGSGGRRLGRGGGGGGDGGGNGGEDEMGCFWLKMMELILNFEMKRKMEV